MVPEVGGQKGIGSFLQEVVGVEEELELGIAWGGVAGTGVYGF